MLAHIKSSQPEGSQHFPVIWLLLERTGNSWMEERGGKKKNLSAALRVFSSPSVDLKALSRSFPSRSCGVQIRGRTCPPTESHLPHSFVARPVSHWGKKIQISTRLLLTRLNERTQMPRRPGTDAHLQANVSARHHHHQRHAPKTGGARQRSLPRRRVPSCLGV